MLLGSDIRGVHIIRDPRDAAISALRYHKDSAEKWLHIPDEQFGGLTYQQKLNSLSPDEQFLFNLQNRTASDFGKMLVWRYDDPRFFEARYEDLADDRDGRVFGKILSFLGLPAVSAMEGVLIFKRLSIFGKPTPQNHPHIRSGKPRQWPDFFTRWHGEKFVEIFGDCLIRLGYEEDNSWVKRLPAKRQI